MSEFDKLKKSLLKKGELYEDADFLPIQSSVFYHQKAPYQFEWKRPKEICADACFISETSSFGNCFNVVQGKLGDIWFTSIIGCLSITKGLFFRVVPADQGFGDDEYVGMFRFRIWWNGEWREVIIDDRLPTVDNKLMFVHSIDGTQFWTSLLEKAYCKLHGSYEALKYGNSLDGLADLTGGVSESISIKDTTRLSDVLLNLLSLTTIVTAVVQKGNKPSQNNSERLENGIMLSTNYRVMSIDEVETIDGDKVQLVRLRNPLGLTTDFVGEWNKESAEWSKVSDEEKTKANLKYLIEGEFYMAYEEFVKTFLMLEVIHLDGETSKDEPSLRGRIPWQMKMIRTCWRKGVTAGGCRNNSETFHLNPQIQVLLPDTDEIVVCLNQHSLIETKVIGFSVYNTQSVSNDHKLDKSFVKKNKSLISSQYTNSKYVSLRTQLQEGIFTVIPTTYEPGQEGLFSLRIYSCKPIKLKLVDCNSVILKQAITKATASFEQKFAHYENLFLQLADEHKTINSFELQELLEACLPNDYVKSCATIEVCRQIVAATDANSTGRIKYNDYKNMMSSLRCWQNTFKNHTKGTSGILRAEKLHDSLCEIGFQLSTEVLSLLILRYMRKDGTLRFGDFVSCILHLVVSFNTFHKKDPLDNGHIKVTLHEFLKVSLI